MIRAALLATILAFVVAGCGDDGGGDDGGTCGPGDAATTLTVTPETGVAFAYGNFTAHDNGDCPDPTAPSVRSLTVFASSPTGDTFAICIARPDKLAGAGLAVTSDTTSDGVQLVTVKGTDAASGCTYNHAFTAAASGTVSGIGVCNAGADDDFALQFAVSATLAKTCGAAAPVDVPIEITGEVAVKVVHQGVQ